jgi:ribosomal protein L44E
MFRLQSLKAAPSWAEEQDVCIDCPNCHSDAIARIRRRGIVDHIRAYCGRWPYYCRFCGKYFYASQRYPSQRPRHSSEAARRAARESGATGPQMAYRGDPQRPIAKIVIQADSHAQMDEILLALNRAVVSRQQPVKQHAATSAH